MSFKRAIIILADGARPDVLKEEMDKGNLPHLSRLSEAGTFQPMLTCFPSTTGPAYFPYLNGCHPGTCNVPGIRWFDKPHYSEKGWGFKSFRSYCGLESFFMDGDIATQVPSIWEGLPQSYSIHNGVTRGIQPGKNITKYSRVLRFYYAHLTDRWKFLDDAAQQALLKVIQKPDFEFAFVVYQSIDEFSHRSSPFHKRVRDSYADIDSYVGDMVKTLKKSGHMDETLICLVSDHGLSETHTHFDIGPWLENEKGLKTFYYTNIFKFKFDAVSMVSGNGMANLYFKGSQGWQGRKSFEEISHDSILLDELRYRDEIDLVVTQGHEGAIHYQTEIGHSHSLYDPVQDRVQYHFSGQDPLGIFKPGEELLQKGFSLDESLACSFDSHFPDVFNQMHTLFKSPRTGDVVVSAKTGYDLREKYEHPLHKGSHGSICPEHMRVPLLMNYKIDRLHVRSVDVFSTVLELLGKNVPQNDGRSLVV